MDQRNECMRLQGQLATICRELRDLGAIDSYSCNYIECGASYYFEFVVNPMGRGETRSVTATALQELDRDALRSLRLYLQAKVAEAMSEARKRGEEAQRQQQVLQEVEL